MSRRKRFSTIFGIAVLSTVLARADAQTTDQAARGQAGNIARAELRTRLNLKQDQFLGVQSDEALEQSLALAVERPRPAFIYRVSPSGEEIKEGAVVHHIATDADLMYIIAIGSVGGGAYRIHGFGPTRSLAEFQKLMTALKVQVTGPDQAEALAAFYRQVNPGNHESLTPILRLMELKQAAERQCQSGGKSFDAGEKAFATWWKRAEPMYAALPFQQRAVPHASGYLVQWIVLSSPSNENCGGAPVRAELEISSDGRVGKVTFSSLREIR